MRRSLSLVLVLALACVSYLWWPEYTLPENSDVTKVVVRKSERTMELWGDDELLKTYKISLGSDPIGHKQFEGDSKTPEGTYAINDKNPNSSYHLNLGISYPNPKDTKRARTLDKNPGGDIKIHGIRNGLGFVGKQHRLLDWTDGCMAVTNSEIEEIYEAVNIGTPVEILP